MGQIAALPGRHAGLPAKVSQIDPWLALPEFKRDQAHRKLAVIEPALRQVEKGISAKAAAIWLHSTCADGLPSVVTLERWISQHKARGLIGLVDGRAGRQRETRGCEHLIVEYYQRPGRLTAGGISFLLKQEHGLDVPGWWINNYLKSLPASVTTHSPKRLGANHHANTVRPHVRRDPDSMEVGEVWVSDGHCLKVICWHPWANKLIRPEVTPILDKRSNYCYGFWVSHAENARDTVYALCSAMRRYDHCPVFFQTDPGPGFDNADVKSLLKDTGTKHVPTRAGNARGKDFGEGFFHLLTDRFSRKYSTFTGKDRTDDALARMQTKVRRGELVPPHFQDIIVALEEYRQAYNLWPQKKSVRLKGLAPADLHADLQRRPLELPIEHLLRPWAEEDPAVRQSEVRYRNRWYRARELAAYNGRRVRMQYDEFDDRVVWLYDLQGRYIGLGELVGKAAHVRESVRADAFAASHRAALKRVERRREIVDDKYNAPLAAGTLANLELGHGFVLPATRQPLELGPAITADTTLQALEQLRGELPDLPPETSEAEGLPPLDLTDLSWLDQPGDDTPDRSDL